jgi:hypothetical protein
MRLIMAEGTAVSANGKVIQISQWTRTGTGDNVNDLGRREKFTGEDTYEIREELRGIRTSLERIEQSIDIKHTSPAHIYRVFGESEEDKQSESIILKAREMLEKSLQHLIQARKFFDDEIERENELDLYFNDIHKISLLPIKSRNFDEIITALLISLQDNITKTYTLEKISALRNVTEIILDNIFISEALLNKCIFSLEKVGFDLSLPLKGVDFDNLL